MKRIYALIVIVFVLAISTSCKEKSLKLVRSNIPGSNIDTIEQNVEKG